MFKELLAKKRYSFHEGFDNWEDAIVASVQPLIDGGAVLPEYVDEIIKCIKKFGPYIIVAPNICMPHAQEGKGVNETAICFMKTNKPVHFSDDPEHDAQLFFVLASTDNEKHLANLSELVDFLEDETTVNKLLNAQCFDDIKDLG
jgi:PTS system ascorbate-specific IIA component